jgi:hypothetical protein
MFHVTVMEDSSDLVADESFLREQRHGGATIPVTSNSKVKNQIMSDQCWYPTE